MKKLLNGGIGLIFFAILLSHFNLAALLTYSDNPTFLELSEYHRYFKFIALINYILIAIILIRITPKTQYQNVLLYIDAAIILILNTIYYGIQIFIVKPPIQIWYWGDLTATLTLTIIVIFCVHIWHIFFRRCPSRLNFDPAKNYKIFFKPLDSKGVIGRSIKIYAHIAIYDGTTKTFYSFRKKRIKRTKNADIAIKHIQNNIENKNILYLVEVERLNNIDSLINKKYHIIKYNCWAFAKEATEWNKT